MRLKNKLFLVVLFSLLLQVIISGSFAIITFLGQSKKSSTDELIVSWHRARSYIERLKHYSFTHLVNLSHYLKDNRASLADSESIIKTIEYFKANMEADRIIVIDEKYRIIVNISSDNSYDMRDLKEIITSYHFSHPSSRFFYNGKKNGGKSLYLITGTRVSGEKESTKHHSIFLIKRFDRALVTKTYEYLGINLAIFAGENFVCSNIPYFKLPEKAFTNTVQPVNTTTGRYNLLSGVIASNTSENIYLVVLKSTLEGAIYAEKLVKSFLLAFLITLSISTVLAISMTAYFTSPFVKLQNWMDRYMKAGKLDELKIHTKDEIGFLTSTFHTLASKLIKEEALIKEQLEKISFLNKYNENILQNLQAGVLVVNSRGFIEYCNDFICRLLKTGADKILSLRVYDFFSSYFKLTEDAEVLKHINVKQNTQIENIIFRKENEEKLKFTAKILPLWQSGQKKNTLIVLEDITKAESSWEKIIQAEKITSLGLLSAGMAHEINNPLGSILSHVQYLTAVEKDTDKLDSLTWIESETGRIAHIVQRLLNFAKSYDGGEESCSLNSVVSEINELLKLELSRKNITITSDLESELPSLALSEGRLKQVILNLLINSIQAVKTDGKISISARNQSDFIEFIIEDNGAGISKEDINYIFDPFFTTKKSESGTGLGLSICYSIITRAGGDIQVQSTPERGTTMNVLIPIEGNK